jgi:hypothetical protein
VRAELGRRTLRSLEDCRALWERGGDPLAIAAAVMLAGELPRWLQDALLVFLVPRDSTARLRRLLAKRWEVSNRDRRHAGRAWELLRVRLSPHRDHPALRLTWERTPHVASASLAKSSPGDGPHTPSAVQQSYQRVARALDSDPWCFWAPPDGFAARHLDALRALVALIERGIRRST